ncbi:partner of Y14 and mago [Lethenteron reissneri]|uniref:partner of Y14 and mago n=1 Tax=Lethenteron reissneri TaxID=7753 RepID=UPI002AB70624|nr:partner of Y14 and mago [Lethenteron reissneri]
MAANYEESDAGKFIPASRRADGTWRKPRRVKEGYVPPEEVPVYENKYVKFYKSKPSLPPGLSVAAADELKQKSQQEGDQSSGAALSKTAKKNLRRKEKRKQQQEPHEGGGEHDENDVAHDSGGDDDTAALSEALHRSSIAERDAGDPGEERKAVAPASTEEPHAAGASDLAKRIKNLKKKLRQIEELEQKIQCGELLQPSKEQQEKLARKSALEQELASLE